AEGSSSKSCPTFSRSCWRYPDIGIKFHLRVMIKCKTEMRNWLLAIAILIGASSALAQRISGELRLQVTDLTGAVLHATGAISGQSTGVERTFETDEMGRFTIRALPPGRYELTIRSEGFAAKTIPIQIESQLPIEQRVTLEVTPLSTTIEVKDETLLDPVQTAQYVPHQALEDR